MEITVDFTHTVKCWKLGFIPNISDDVKIPQYDAKQ